MRSDAYTVNAFQVHKALMDALLAGVGIVGVELGTMGRYHGVWGRI
jgi:hypothetical protein